MATWVSRLLRKSRTGAADSRGAGRLPPTDEEIVEARKQWWQAVRGRASRIALAAGVSYILLHLVANMHAVRVLFRDFAGLFDADREAQVDWSWAVGVADSDAILLVTTLVLLAATMTIAVVASPRVADLPLLYDRVALASWARSTGKLAGLVTAVAAAVALTRVPSSPVLALVLGLVVVPAGVLATITGQRVHDQVAAGLERAELKRVQSEIGRLEEHGYGEHLPRPRTSRPVAALIVMVTGSAAMGALWFILYALATLELEMRSLFDVLAGFLYLFMVGVLAGAWVIPALWGCSFWRWWAQATGHPRWARAGQLTAVLIGTGWIAWFGLVSRDASIPGEWPGWLPLTLFAAWPVFTYTFLALFARKTQRGPVASAAWAVHDWTRDEEKAARRELDRQAARNR